MFTGINLIQILDRSLNVVYNVSVRTLLSRKVRKMGCKLVAYRRVSTAKQGESGLGLEGQDAAIQAHVKATGCDLVASYTEVESSTYDDLADRPELVKAIRHAK